MQVANHPTYSGRFFSFTNRNQKTIFWALLDYVRLPIFNENTVTMIESLWNIEAEVSAIGSSAPPPAACQFVSIYRDGHMVMMMGNWREGLSYQMHLKEKVTLSHGENFRGFTA